MTVIALDTTQLWQHKERRIYQFFLVSIFSHIFPFKDELLILLFIV